MFPHNISYAFTHIWFVSVGEGSKEVEVKDGG